MNSLQDVERKEKDNNQTLKEVDFVVAENINHRSCRTQHMNLRYEL